MIGAEPLTLTVYWYVLFIFWLRLFRYERTTGIWYRPALVLAPTVKLTV